MKFVDLGVWVASSVAGLIMSAEIVRGDESVLFPLQPSGSQKGRLFGVDDGSSEGTYSNNSKDY